MGGVFRLTRSAAHPGHLHVGAYSSARRLLQRAGNRSGLRPRSAGPPGVSSPSQMSEAARQVLGGLVDHAREDDNLTVAEWQALETTREARWSVIWGVQDGSMGSSWSYG